MSHTKLFLLEATDIISLVNYRYILAFFEVAAVLGTSSTWRVVSFKKTHLVERMGLLTLIIFGEGIIVMLKGINTVVKGFGWTKTMVGVIVAGLLVIVSSRPVRFGRVSGLITNIRTLVLLLDVLLRL